MLPTIQWQGNQIRMIDQRRLPARIQWYTCKGYRDVVSAIEKMVIRGAPAIGVAAAMGLALGAASIKTDNYGDFRRRFSHMAKRIAYARPTAVNLRWAVDRMSALVDSLNDHPVLEIKRILRRESEEILKQDIDINKEIGKIGQTLIHEKARILTHCNAGALATVGYGTALGVIRAAHAARKRVEVLADETRPWLQGLRLTSFELMEDGIPVQVIVDNAAGSFMRRKMVDMVITGADRIAANGDVANKIGTYQVAVLAKENRVPFYVAAPLSTIDTEIPKGDIIPVEERPPQEITRLGRQMIGPPGVKVLNPAFDITPARYITAIITEKGIIKPPYLAEIRRLLKATGKTW